MLSKKNFEMKAKEIATIRDGIARELKIKEYIRFASKSNPAFNEGRFREYINELRAGKSPSGRLSFSKKTKWVSTDAWRGYEQPVYAVAGASDTGSWSDSPNPSIDVEKEMNMIKKELAQIGVPTKEVVTRSSNVFMGKRWLIAPKGIYPKAKKKSKELLKKMIKETSYLHGVD